MKVAFMLTLPPERQEKVFDVWLRLRRHPDGNYSAMEIAEAMIDQLTKEAKAIALDIVTVDREIEEAVAQWYRRYRINGQKRAQPRTASAFRKAAARLSQRTASPKP